MNFRKYLLFLFVITLFSNCGIRKKYDPYNLKELNSEERKIFINQNIDTLKGTDLWNFISHVEKSNVNINKFDNSLKLKLSKSIYAYDIYLLSSLLLDKKGNKNFVQKTLNNKILKWDKGSWGNKFWNLIKSKKLNVQKPNFYEFKNGFKKYDFDKFLNTKTQNGELGQNPILFLNDRLTNYEKGDLNTLLKDYEIIQIDYIRKKEAVGLFGKRGIDGHISVITK